MATRTSIPAVFLAGPAAANIATAAYNQPAGDTITLALSWESDTGAATTITVSDTAGNSTANGRYVIRVIGTTATSTNLQYVALVDCINCLGNAANVITVTFTGDTAQKAQLKANRWTPANTIAFKAVSAIASGNSTTPLTAAISAGDFAVAAQKNWSAGAVTPNSGWTSDATNTEVNAFYRSDSPGGTYTAGCSIVGADVWTIAVASYIDAVLPSITSVDSDNSITSAQTGVVWAGTNFGATQGASTVTLVQGSTSIAQTVTAWSDTSITTTTVFDGSTPDLKYGTATATVTVAGNSGTLTITVTPPDDRSWVTLTSVNSTSAFRISGIADLTVGDQLEVTSVTGGAIGDVTLYSDGTASWVPGVTSFTVRAWSAADSLWGAEGTELTSLPAGPRTYGAFANGPFASGAFTAVDTRSTAASGTQSYSYSATGGLTVGGAVSAVRKMTKDATGGLQLGGAAAAVRASIKSATGGIQLSGSAPAAYGKAIAASGGLTIGGAATVIRGRSVPASGGIVISGAATYSSSGTQSYSYSATGGLLLGGTAGVLRSLTVNGQGGIILGGAAGYSNFTVGAVVSSKRNRDARRRGYVTTYWGRG